MSFARYVGMLGCLAVLASAACKAPFSIPDASKPVLRIDPDSIGPIPGRSLQLKAIFADPTDRVLSNTVVVWSSSAPDLAQVTEDGIVIGLFPGQALITARYGRFRADQPVVVDPSPACAPPLPGRDPCPQFSSTPRPRGIHAAGAQPHA